MSMKRMLKFVVEVLCLKVNPESIYKASPTGELAHCFFLYYAARRFASPWPRIEEKDRDANPALGDYSNDFSRVYVGGGKWIAV